MNRICIAIVFHSENIQSGATRSLMDIVDYLIKTQKYKIIAIFPQKEGSAITYLNKRGIECYSYQYGGLMQNLTQPILKRLLKVPFLFIRMFNIIHEAKVAARELETVNIDLVYSNTSSIVFGGYLGRFLKCKQAWHIREFRKQDHRIEFFLGDRYLQKFINKCADAVLFVSNSVKTSHEKYIDNNKMFVTYNSYPENYITPKNIFNENLPLQILIAGDIKPSKGQLDCVKAVKMVITKQPEIRMYLHIAGRKSHDAYYKEIINYIHNNNMNECVILHGQVSDMITLRKFMDMGIVSSTNEAFGRTTIEGMLSMMTMVGRNSGGTTEQIQNGKTGLLYDGTIEDLADKLVFLNNNRNILKQLAINGFNYCVEHHTKGRCAKIAEQAIMYAMYGAKEENVNAE